MTMALALAFPAILLIGLATPRQSSRVLGASPARSRIVGWRLAGWLLLIASLGPVLSGSDRGRQIIGWIGAIGMIALCVALAFTALTRRNKP